MCSTASWPYIRPPVSDGEHPSKFTLPGMTAGGGRGGGQCLGVEFGSGHRNEPTSLSAEGTSLVSAKGAHFYVTDELIVLSLLRLACWV